MKTDYYLMVTDWGVEPQKQDFDMIRKVEGISSRQAKEKALEYERELNKGKVFNMEKMVLEKDTDIRYRVLAIPYSQAREYTSFDTWKCNKEA